MSQTIYHTLAKHLSALGMGYPEKEELFEILQENFTLSGGGGGHGHPHQGHPF